MKKLKLLQVFCIIAFSTGVSFSQENVAYPTRVIFPQAFWSYGNEMSSELPISVGPFDNYVISPTSGFLETDICVNPSNPNNFVATDNRITGFVGPTYVYYTTDGGVTWNAPYPNGTSGNQGDPAFTADGQGNFYLCVLQNGPLVYKSVNGGASWTNLGIVVSNGSADKEWIAADQTTGTYQNNVYVAYVNFATGASVDFHRSTNNGVSWSFIGNMGSGTPNPGPDVAVDPDGRVILAWYGGGGTAVRVSTDGGASFAAQVTASAHNTPGVVNCSGRNVLKDSYSNGFRVNGMPHIAIDMTSGSRRGYIYDLYATNPPGPDDADIYMTRSTDHGATWNWTTPLRVNNDATILDQVMCDVSVDNQGRIWAMWWDSRNDPSNLLMETYGAVSTDGGVTFSPNFPISNQNFNPLTVRIFQGSCHYYMGDYQGISGKGITFPCWAGGPSSPYRQDFTAYLPDYGMSFALNSDNIAPGSTSWNRVRLPLMGPYAGTVTLSATVSPSPAPGTITFNWVPGNVRTITGSPDSVILNSVVSGTVPSNAYTVTVTGTESSGPRTHQRSWTLNVDPSNTGLHNNNNEIPREFSLEQNYPNPFNPTTTINFRLPKASFVTLNIYDILGNEVMNVVNEYVQAGNYSTTVDASTLASGIYFYKMNAGEFADVKKLMLLK